MILLLAFIVGINYINLSLRRAAATPEPSKTPELDSAPLRLYGRVEPLGREVFLGPLEPKRVTTVLVNEGEEISKGQILLELDSEVEQQAVQIAMTRVSELEAQLNMVLDELKRVEHLNEKGKSDSLYALQVPVLRVRELESRLALVMDELRRKEPLLRAKAVSEQNYTQKSLEAEIIRNQIATAKAEAELNFSQKKLLAESIRSQIETARNELELKKRELAQLTLTSPVDGLLYKCDVRPGELLTPADYQRIVLGDRRRQIRVFVETFWLGKLMPADSFVIKDGETLEVIGEGKVSEVSKYVGARDFRSEDSLERLDTKYAQAILLLSSENTEVPLGKLVLCERKIAPGEHSQK